MTLLIILAALYAAWWIAFGIYVRIAERRAHPDPTDRYWWMVGDGWKARWRAELERRERVERGRRS